MTDPFHRRINEMQPKLYAVIIAGLGILAIVLQTHAFAADDTSDKKIKATATATKLGADGKQTVTISLEIEKGWYIYANPLNTNTDVLDGNETRLSVKSKDKVVASVKYPAGKRKKDGRLEYDIYQDRIEIKAEVQRTAGDSGPLQISIDVNTCRKGECLLPGTVKLTVP
jgi:DsbC/DsbD-like thiol-disulfide interchange protein